LPQEISLADCAKGTTLRKTGKQKQPKHNSSEPLCWLQLR